MARADRLLLEDLHDLDADGDEEDDEEGNDGQVQHAAELFKAGAFTGGGKLFLDEKGEQHQDANEGDGASHGGGGDGRND